MDLLLGIDVFVEVMMHGWQTGIPGSPVAFKTSLGWVLAGKPGRHIISDHFIALHASVLSDDDVLQKFWKIEEHVPSTPVMSAEERYVVKHFNENHSHAADGRFIISLSRKPEAGILGESRS